MYDGLLTRDGKMKVVPELASSWKQIDATTYEFKLVPGVKFHSGEELTAEDVKFTIDRMIRKDGIDGQTSPRAGLLGPLKEVQATVNQEYTVRLVLSAPWAILPAGEIVLEIVRSEGGRQGDSHPGRWHRAVPAGRVAQGRLDHHGALPRLLRRLAGGSAGQPGEADHVIFKVIPEMTRIAALLAGDVDIAEVPVHMMLKQIEANPNTRVAKVNGTRTFFVALRSTTRWCGKPRTTRSTRSSSSSASCRTRRHR